MFNPHHERTSCVAGTEVNAILFTLLAQLNEERAAKARLQTGGVSGPTEEAYPEDS
jgi:hypothetical protein